MTFKESLDSSFEQMMSYRIAVGYATSTYRSSVPPFLDYCAQHYPEAEHVSQEMLDGWFSFYGYSNNSQAAFISLVREFTRYRNFLGYPDYIPDEDYTLNRTAYDPYLFTDDELSGLFFTIDSYTGSTCGKRFMPEMVLPVYSRLLFCRGLHPQEPPAIRHGDVDLATGDIYIQKSKRHKDRHLIISADMLDLRRRYDEIAGKREWSFQKWDGRPYERTWYNQVWRRLITRAEIQWRGTPRPYDLRHAFASRNIIRWINAGRDVMELMPYLSAYMGYSDLASTFYYIHLLLENLRKSKAIDWELLSGIYGKGMLEDED